jgi:hypothetical protein
VTFLLCLAFVSCSWLPTYDLERFAIDTGNAVVRAHFDLGTMFRVCRLIAGPYSTIRVNPVLLTVEPLVAVTVMLYVPVGVPGFGGGGGGRRWCGHADTTSSSVRERDEPGDTR